MAPFLGYSGSCLIGGVPVPVNSFNIDLQQKIEYYDHILGLKDSFTKSGRFGKKTTLPAGEYSLGKKYWRPGTYVASGGISFPATFNSLKKVYELAKTGDSFTIVYNYACKTTKRTISKCRINSFNFQITAGDILSLNIDVMGENIVDSAAGSNSVVGAKLITWDAVKITTGEVAASDVQSMQFTVNNSCNPIYTAGSLYPELRLGTQSVSGSISYYMNSSGTLTKLSGTTTNATIKISIKDAKCGGNFEETLCVIYKPVKRVGGPGVTTAINEFEGIGFALG